MTAPACDSFLAEHRHFMAREEFIEFVMQQRAEVWEKAAKLAENPYGDEVAVIGREEPKAVGLKIAAAIYKYATEEAKEPQS